MKKFFVLTGMFCLFQSIFAGDILIQSPDGNLKLGVSVETGNVSYNVSYKGKAILDSSPLGLVTDVSDFSKSLKLVSQKDSLIEENYELTRIKKSKINYEANEKTLTFANAKDEKISIVFRISNNDIALKYKLAQNGERANCTIQRELTGFKFPVFTTAFLTPQATPMIGWMRTKPSYEEEYVPDQPIGTPSKYGVGFTFPGLFHVGDNGWALVSETGVTGAFCASKLSEGSKEGLYAVAYPEQDENNGIGSNKPSIALPGETPWRTITVGDNLQPIVETTVAFDVVKQLYNPSVDYRMGRSTWSWLMWQDASIIEKDQRSFIDLASEMGYEFCLIDGGWEKNIGRERIEELVKYANSKNVEVTLWYNSNGYWNDAPQDPKGRMDDPIARREEMKWMQRLGVKAIKVDFFGGDKQETMKLYEAILVDANDFGIAVIFHGCTLPRGWERMYPNYVASEAVLASENLYFTQHANDEEAYNACLHPFIRNAVGAMEFGPVLLNKYHNRNNDGGSVRKTSETFQLATAVLFQSAIQNFGIAPNNLKDCGSDVIDFMKQVPTTWDDVRFIDGYPGKYCVLARRHGDKWYVVAMNAEKETKKVKVKLPFLTGKTVSWYEDKEDATTRLKKVNINRQGEVNLTIKTGGAVVIVE
jgi:Glycoside hydrolase 97/Glycosyl-hydrolase 97 N-terminal/Glycosyl-hydrolase 97 C-terminal, oligomerisation